MPIYSCTRRIFRLLLATLFFIIVGGLAQIAWAQKDAGAIVGLVRDGSGALIPDARVVVIDVDRGTEIKLTTNHDGEYVASPLKIGQYKVIVDKQGFKKTVAGPVQVNIQDRVAVDVTLQLGAATESVTVTQRGNATGNRDFRSGASGGQSPHQCAALERAELRATGSAGSGRGRRRTGLPRGNNLRIQFQWRACAAK